MKQSYFFGILLCLIATISWGGMFPIMTSALKIMDPFTLTTIRYTIAGIAFILLLIKIEGIKSLKINKKSIFLIWFFGTAGFAGFGFLVFLGQQLSGDTGALSASIMMATMPLLGIFVNWFAHKILPPFYSFIFICLSFLGVVLVISGGNFSSTHLDSHNYIADLCIILGALCWVIYTIGGSFFPNYSPIKYTAISTLLGLVSIYVINILLIITHSIDLPSLSNTLNIIPHLFYMTFIAGFIGVLFWNFGNRIITPTNGVLFMNVVPITAFIFSSLQGIIPTNIQILGVFISATALILNNLFQRKKMMEMKP